MAKMSGGDVNVEPYLDRRNTKGYGTATQILKPRSSKCVGERNGPKNGWDMRKWWRYAGVYMVYAIWYMVWWAPEQNLVEIGRKRGRWMEMLLPGVGCPGGRPDVQACRAGCPGSGSGDEQYEHRVERSNPCEISGICGWKLGGNGWEARSTQNKENPRIQTNKISTHQQITK